MKRLIHILDCIPAQWKTAIVIPFLKKGKNAHDPQNYRPISLTSIVAKIMERMVNNRLNWFLQTQNSLVPEQAGFRKYRSTMELVSTLAQHIKDTFDHGNILTAVFVDFKSAYDSFWKENVMLKLTKMGVQSKM